MKVLSLIVPAYNSERFLDKGITSFLHNEIIDKLDIIIVNDGSTDGTASVVQKYCKMYPESICLINQENRGHGGALNTGCALAVGKYLKVIDADDWVETQNLPAFVEALNACDDDVVLTHYYTTNISNGEIKHWKCYPKQFGKTYSMDEIMVHWKDFDRGLMFHGITYRTAFYHQYAIRLSEHVFYEDHEFATFPCCRAKSIMPLDLFVYNYRIGDVEQSVSDKNQLKRIGHTETVLYRLVDEYQNILTMGNAAASDYVCMKTQRLLLSYLTTALLIEPNKARGREMARRMMEYFQNNMSIAYGQVKKRYQIFFWMNIFHMNKRIFDLVLRSRIYNRLQNKHDFK